MKKILYTLGILLLLAGIIPLFQYLLDYNVLSEYGKGYVWGKIILVLGGLGLVLAARRVGRSKV